jgi:hypothetical protein
LDKGIHHRTKPQGMDSVSEFGNRRGPGREDIESERAAPAVRRQELHASCPKRHIPNPRVVNLFLSCVEFHDDGREGSITSQF